MKKILITGGAGFVGSSISIALKENFQGCDVIVLDNLYRKGSELNLPRLKSNGIKFIRGDVRNPKDIEQAGKMDFLIECSAEPSVLAGKDGDTDYLIQTNLYGALNCAEYCRKSNAGMLFLSTSRVYPFEKLLKCGLHETEKRFDFSEKQDIAGISPEGLTEKFPMDGARSLYGATKYASEIMLAEYRDRFSIPVIINRCGVIAGPWQFGKSDQGIAVFWTAAHIFKKTLKYIGFGGSGKQVRDFLHIKDLIDLIIMQLKTPEAFSAEKIFNAGGGKKTSASLIELSGICAEITGNSLSIAAEKETRYADIPVYITDNSKINAFRGWSPRRSMRDIIADINDWIKNTPEASRLFESN
ncbi:MAG: 3-beta hydroxysteroid dehydrogenase [Lentisphaerae bacterium GWF2_44_16]|nr:MAG: 3-beta hydroxysteroid dehydrogenase [Lentisphaerae bacterium GWF2_44_16]